MPPCRLIVLVLLAVLTLTSTVNADTGVTPAVEIKDNYRFSLQYRSQEGETTKVDFVVAGKTFQIGTFDPFLKFSGTILTANEGELVLQYTLQLQKRLATPFDEKQEQQRLQSIKVVDGGLKSNVRLKLGTPIELFAVDKEEFQLTVSTVE